VRSRAIVLALVLLALPVTAAQQPGGVIPTPVSHFGFRIGDDGQLATAEAIEKYFEAVATASDRVRLTDLGPTTDGHRTIAAFVSAAENIRNLDQIRIDNQRLADPRTLDEADARRLAAAHKVVIVIGCSIHATEIGASQAAIELLHWLATSNDAATLDQLQRAVIVVIPMLNPDGHRLVVDWYNKFRNTPFEGAPLPWPDHKYAGHDINRDAFMMNMAESRNLARFFYTEWHPQIFLSMHQLEPDGPRFVAPPVTDPIDSNVDPIIWREAALLGSAMTLELERDRHTGVVSNSLFDYYWPGYEDSAPLGHNIVCLLTEAASVKIATPVTQPAPDQRGHVSAPHPWPGGRWALRDIVDYELSAVRGLLRAATAYHDELVWNFYEMGRRAIEAGQKESPFAYIIPPDQQDVLAAIKLKQLLLEGGIEIQHAQEAFVAGGAAFPTGSDIVFLAQPYRAYVKTLLERQDYPGDRSTDRPYDVTGWTLPAQMAVDVRFVEKGFDPPVMSKLSGTGVTPPRATIWGDKKPGYYLVEARGNAGAVAANRLFNAKIATSWLDAPMDVNGFRYPAGTLVVAAGKATMPILSAITAQLGLRVDGVKGKPPAPTHAATRSRVAVYQPRGANADTGWTRWVLEQYEFQAATITNADVASGNLRARYDAIVLPSAPAEVLSRGLPADVVPPEYAGGLDDDGVRQLDAFVRAGGTLICLDQSCAFAIDAFKLPIRDVARTTRDLFYCPGSILRIDVDTSQPLSYGLPEHTAGFFASSAAFEVAPNAATLQTAVRYAGKELLISGWLHGESVIAGRSAVVQASLGTGRIVLLGFPVQHRGQSLATFRLLFNAILSAR
jgi:zinc carboxypeptidase